MTHSKLNMERCGSWIRSHSALLGAVLMMLVLHGMGLAWVEGYGSTFSLRSMAVLAALVALAAAGQTLVVLLGGIDLSIPFIIGFANVLAAEGSGRGLPFVVVFIGVVLLAGCIGAAQGALAAHWSIHPLIVTLGVGTFIQGAVMWWTQGLPSGSAPQSIVDFVSIGASWGPLPVPALLPFFALLTLLLAWVLARTPFGRQLYAAGANPKAAPYALISVARLWTWGFALSAMLAALTGVLLLGFTGSAYGAVGQPYLFQTIAAVVIGGTALTGGSGSIWGTVIGAVVLTQLNTLLIGLGLPHSMVQACLGAVICVLVSLYGRERHVRELI